jgi:glycine hydroxymethyltransferase
MKEQEMGTIADFMARIVVEQEAPQNVVDDVIAFREPYQTVYYCFDNGIPV